MPSFLQCFDHLDQIEAKLEEWAAFSDRCRLAAPFCGPLVWVPWLRAHRHLEPAVYEWREGNRLQALLPCFRRGNRLEMATGWHLDYQDLAALDDEAAVGALLAVIGRETARSGMIVFPKVAVGSRLARALEDPRVAAVSHPERRYWSRCPVATITRTGPGGFVAALPARQRKDYRNAGRRLSEAFPDQVVAHHGPGGIDPALLDEAGSLHRANQYRKDGASVCEDPAYLSFLKEQSAIGAPICLSLIRERPGGPLMAFHLGYFDGATFFYYLTAYAGGHAKLSPGRWLLVDGLRHWYDRTAGVPLRLDMLCGEEDYKSRWPAETYDVARIVLIPKRLSNLPRIVAYTAVYTLKNAKSRLLSRPSGGRLLEPEPEDLVLPG